PQERGDLGFGRLAVADLRDLLRVEVGRVGVERARELVTDQRVVPEIEAHATRGRDATGQRGGPAGVAVAQALHRLAVAHDGALAIRIAEPLADLLLGGL